MMNGFIIGFNDHVGFNKNNPRKRATSFHEVYDFYNSLKKNFHNRKDTINWHYHPLAIINDVNRSGNTYLNSNNVYEILSRKIIERNYFPAIFRPGFHTERPDSHWFLEQWIPFDYGNQSYKSKKTTDQPDLDNGRYGNWYNAPLEWKPYNPDYYDYRKKGDCNRYITRCLNMEARLRELKISDIEDAFVQANKYGKSLLSFTNHDYRDMKNEIKKTWNNIKKVSKKYKNIKFKYVDSFTA